MGRILILCFVAFIVLPSAADAQRRADPPLHYQIIIHDDGSFTAVGPGGYTDYHNDGTVCTMGDNGVELTSYGCHYDPQWDNRRNGRGNSGVTPSQGGSTGSGTNGGACTSGYTMTNGMVQCGSGRGGQKR